MTTATVHVVARGVYWRDADGREYLRAASLDGSSWRVDGGAAPLSPDVAAALRVALVGGVDGGSTGPIVVRRYGSGLRWQRSRRECAPAWSTDHVWVCELTDGELRELIMEGMPRAVYTRLSRAIAAGAPESAAVSAAITSPRLCVSMRGRHGVVRGSGGTAAAAAPKAARVSVPGPVRPSGELYYPRILANGETDVDVVRKLNAEGVSVLLYGPPGTGKTALLEAALGDFLMVPGSSDTEAADFLGAPVPEPGGSYVWVDGPLLVAARRGVPLIVDEIALVDPRAMAVVYEAMDGRGTVTVTSWPSRGTQTIAPGFCLHGACNPDAPGADMSEALLSRMTFQLEYGTDYALAERLGAPAELVTAARNLDKQRQEGEIVWSPQMRELLGWVKVARLLSPELAYRNLAASAPVMDRPVVCDVLSRHVGWQVEGLRLGEGAV